MKDIKIDENSVKRCPECGGVMGEDIDGEPICGCSVPPRLDDGAAGLAGRLAKGDPPEIHRPHIAR